jgi:hypothetical protein
MTPKRYCQITVLIALGVLAAIAAFNMLVDPYRVYPGAHLAAFDRLRDSMSNRRARAELVRQGGWEMMIFGTSRPKGGMPSVHPAFASNKVCNLSLDAARMSEAAAIFDYARKHNRVQHVILCLDFALSRQTQVDPSDFAESRFNEKLSLFNYHCKSLIGSDATDRSFKFVTSYVRKDFPPAGERDGFQVRALKPDASQHALFQKVLRSLAFSYSIVRSAPEEMEAFRRLLRTCRDHNVRLTMAINPVHALDLELMRAGGNWDGFENWKRDIVSMVAEEGMADRAALWDFSGYWSPTMEEVPPPGDTATRMKYYFENSHYTPAMGALMLDQMFGYGTMEFGARITASNIEAHLQHIRAQRAPYALSHAGEIRQVQEISRRALAGRRRTAAAPEEME